MSELEYYHATHEPVVGVLEQLVKTHLAAVPPPWPGDMLAGAYVLRHTHGRVADVLREQLSAAQFDPEEGLVGLDCVAFVNGLRPLAVVDEDWIALQDESDVRAFLADPARTGTFNTLQFLGCCIYALFDDTFGCVPHGTMSIVTALASKFEIFGRIFCRYRAGIRKADDRFGCIAIYAILSMVLLERFRREDAPQLLSTALKQNDMLSGTVELLSRPAETLLVLSALDAGERSVEQYYDRKGFRLPPR